MTGPNTHPGSGGHSRSLLIAVGVAVLVGMSTQFAPATTKRRLPKADELDRMQMEAIKNIFPRAQVFPRPPGLAAGRRFPSVPQDQMRKPSVVHTRAGSFDLLALSSHIPAELLGSSGSRGAAGASVRQLEPGTVYLVLPSETGAAGRSQVKRHGLKILDFLMNNTYAVRLPSGNVRGMQVPADFKAVVPYPPAFHRGLKVGMVPLTNRAAASSSWYFLTLVLWEEESPEPLVDMLARDGGVIYSVYSGPTDGWRIRFATKSRGMLQRLERHQSVRFFEDTSAQFGFSPMASVIPSVLMMGYTNQGQRPLYDAGVDGGGDPSRNILPQFVAITDDGLSLDSSPFAHSLNAPDLDPTNDSGPAFCINNPAMTCSTNSDCPTDDFCKGVEPDVGPTHRKVETYIPIQDLPACVAGPCVAPIADPGAAVPTGGDFRTCDSFLSGNRTHGQIVAHLLAGNPTEGPQGLGIRRDDRLVANTPGLREIGEPNVGLDGVARGARVIFQDAGLTTDAIQCYLNDNTDVDLHTFNPSPGVIASGNLINLMEQAAFRTDLDPANFDPLDPVLHERGARIHVLPFGVPNFDQFDG
ncbi:MAG: hypothetical protein V3U86_12730, partial [Acidobacteriota bacterium]